MASDHREVIFPLPPETEVAMAETILEILRQDLDGDGVAAVLPTRNTRLSYEGTDYLRQR